MLRDIEFRNKITLLSLAMAVLIVVRHGNTIDVYGLSAGLLYWIECFVGVVTDLIVPAFFVISGYLFSQNFNWNYCKL